MAPQSMVYSPLLCISILMKKMTLKVREMAVRACTFPCQTIPAVQVVEKIWHPQEASDLSTRTKAGFVDWTLQV